MTKPGIEIGGIHIGSNTSQSSHAAHSNKNPFHALIFANLSGNANDGNQLKIKQIDRDNFDDVLASIQPSLKLSIQDKHSLDLSFKTLEDFEPDSLFDQLPIFSQLRTLRRKLSNQATFAEAAAELQIESTVPASQPAEIAPESNEQSSEGNLLDSLLMETTKRQETATEKSSDLASSLIRDIVAPHIIPSPDPKKQEYINSVDTSISELMNTILHHPQFQALESTWRGLYFLVKKTVTDSKLKLFTLDIDKNRLATFVDCDEISNTEIYKQLIDPYHNVPGATPWSVWFGDYQIEDNANDIFFLERMGKHAEACQISFISAASPHLLSCQSLASHPDPDDWQMTRDGNIVKAWKFLRDSAQAKHLALLFPRFLLRLPYGLKTKAVESFEFEEMPEPNHNNYLWGNAGFACLLLLAESYSENQWQFKPGQISEVSGLPLHTYEEDDEHTVKPTAEILLTESTAPVIANNGIIPVWSVKNEDKIRIGPMISMFSEHQLIQGNWVC